MFFAALLVALIVALPAEAASKPASSLRIVAFGDSLTSGHRLPQKDAWPAVIQKKLNTAGLPFTIYNKGVSGDTTTGALRRLDAALEVKPSIAIIELGVNDGLRGMPIAQVRANLEKIITAFQQQHAQVLLCAMETPPFNGWQYTIAFHRMYEDLASKYEVPLIPFVMNGVLGNPDLISDDGVHPNAVGARYIADTIWEYLEPIAKKVEKGETVVPVSREPSNPEPSNLTRPDTR